MDIPAGSHDGDEVRVPMGNAGTNGEAAGDFVLSRLRWKTLTLGPTALPHRRVPFVVFGLITAGSLGSFCCLASPRL